MSVSVVIFSIGLVLTMATQLRVAGLPLGPGEALLAAWTVASWLVILRRKHVRMPPDLMPFVWFFALVVVLLVLSVFYQILRLGVLYDNAVRGTIAFVFVAMLIVTFGFLQPSRAYVLGCLKLVTLGLTLSLSGLMAANLFMNSIGPIDLSNGVRFFGWANNPNQIGMALTPLPFVCLFLLREAKSALSRLVWLGALSLALWVGFATQSDALRIAWMVGGLLLLLITLLRRIVGRAYPTYAVVNVFAVAVLALLVLILLPAGEFLFDKIAAGDGGGHRFDLWREAGARLLDSPFVGLGPGAKELDVDYRAFGEAHNSYIDFALTTGALGSLGAISLVVSLMLRPSLIARPTLWAGFMGLQFFTMFHYVFRHPLFSFYLVLMAAFAYRDHAAKLAQPVPSDLQGSTRRVTA